MDLYSNIQDSAANCCEGNVKDAEWFTDCSYYQYFERIAIKQRWGAEQKRLFEEAKNR